MRRQAAVILLGPRQVGKTTLAREIGKKHGAIYLDLENPDDRRTLDQPALFFESMSDRLVILDEIHMMPGLFQYLRGIIDKGRREGKGKGRFLILGSASLDLLRQSGETLAGRVAYIDMGSMTVLEVKGDAKVMEMLWQRGGFPESFLADSDENSYRYRQDLIRNYLEKDIPSFGYQVSARKFEQSLRMLAHSQGRMVNNSEQARALEVSSKTVSRYIDSLSALLLVRHLPPYVANIGKRLVKTHKTYIRDSGFVHVLLNIKSLEELLSHPVCGHSWEGFVIENIHSVMPFNSFPMFYKTSAGAEIDLVIEHSDRSIWAIEIKRSSVAHVRKGFYQSIRDLKPAKAFVVHAGNDRYPLRESVEAISLVELMAELQAMD